MSITNAGQPYLFGTVASVSKDAMRGNGVFIWQMWYSPKKVQNNHGKSRITLKQNNLYNPPSSTPVFAMQEDGKDYNSQRLEYTNIVSNTLFLVLCNALGYPGDVANFLINMLAMRITGVGVLTCSRSLTQAYTMECVNCRVKASLEISISFS